MPDVSNIHVDLGSMTTQKLKSHRSLTPTLYCNSGGRISQLTAEAYVTPSTYGAKVFQTTISGIGIRTRYDSSQNFVGKYTPSETRAANSGSAVQLSVKAQLINPVGSGTLP